MGTMDKRVLFLLIALLALSLSPVSPHSWELAGVALQPANFPAGYQVLTNISQGDLDSDGIQESLVVKAGQASIFTGGKLLWQSPQEWDVRQASLADLNHDGQLEVVLLVWRPFKPWPVDRWLPKGGRISGFHNDRGESCQIILIGWNQGEFRERWAGSALAEPVKAFTAADLDGDGLVELITLDSNYAASENAPANLLKVWEWNGFGFSRVSSVGGSFSDLTAVQSKEDRVFLITQ
jgi:hypothetical protein